MRIYFLLLLSITLLLVTSNIYTQQEIRTLQPQLVRDQSLFPLQSTGIWTEVHPLIPRVDYWGVDFVNADTGWAVGEGGAIVKTTNGGGKWIWYESGVGNTLRTVAALNNGERIIAAGDGGIILISEDGGELWNTIPSGTTDNIWNMQMITEQIGWMVGEGGTALKTTNGGMIWVQQSMPFPSAPYWDLSFIDTLFGYICSSSGIVLKTTNGGGSWIIQQAGDTRSLYTIFALDTLRASAGGFAGKVVYTIDGGINWLTAGGGISAAEINKIKFINNIEGFLASSGGFYKSTNAGANWSSIQDLIVSGSSPTTTNLSFPTEGKGYITGYKMLIAKTNDTGESWVRTIVNSDFINVYFKNAQEGFINSNNLIYKTNDGGYTLDTLVTFPYSLRELTCLTFFDSLTGYTGTGRMTIYKTINRGVNWYQTNITGLNDTVGSIQKIFFYDQTYGWAVSTRGYILGTSDGGENWVVQLNLGISNNFNSINFNDSLNGWATARYLYKTTDGGITWQEQMNSNILFPWDIYFINDTLGICSESNELYKTTDGGVIWGLDSSVFGFGQGRFGYFDASNIFITGTKVYRTTNAGLDWTDFPELEGQGWRLAITLLTVNSGYLVGNTGLIVKYYDESVPVELINFEGRLNVDGLNLHWTTATETNNYGFEIEKSFNNNNWETIGFIPGKGTSTEINYYSFNDPILSAGEISYRLKQIDLDGTYSYSNVITISVGDLLLQFKLAQNFPNPFNPTTKIKFAIPTVETRHTSSLQMVSLKIFDILGNEVVTLINEEKPAGVYEVEFNVETHSNATLPSGVYFYQLKAGSFIQTKKMIILK